jgi:beta-glucanase (GH16 family)
MRTIQSFFSLLAFFSFISLSSAQQWELVWEDNFEQEGLPDPDKWSYETGYIRNNEKQYYTEARLQNVRQENGQLIIEAHRDNYEGHEYTSASIHTKNTATWQYGRFEVRAKVPTGNGTWPAAWMLGVNISEVGWPMSGEIDIMEYVGFDPDRAHGNVHTKAYNHNIQTNKGATVELPDAHKNFHVYAVEWSPEKIDFFVDEINYFTFENEGKGIEEWPFDQPFYLILNLAIGGGWGGQQGVDDTLFPHQYIIDYVKVYQKL